jgi:MFS family permease
MTHLDAALARRSPVFYGWVIVAVAFVTMALGVNARTAFSLLFPPILDEFGWDRGATAAAFSFGFVVTALVSPLLGWLMDRRGPRVVVEIGVALVAAGLLLAPFVHARWHFYLTLGVLVGGGSVCLSYTGQALYLPNWFARRRALAMSLAFSGVGAGSIVVLPWLQRLIEHAGWRAACVWLGVVVLVVLAPLNVLLIKRPEHVGLAPDGDEPAPPPSPTGGSTASRSSPDVRDWTLARSLRAARFWWIASAYLLALYAWYAVQVHQTKYLIEVGFSPASAAWSLGLVSLVAIPGQIALGHLADRVGREWVWTIGNVGFALCYVALLALRSGPSVLWLDVMIVAQGALGYGLVSVIGAIPADTFQGPHYGRIFGSLMLASIVGGALGPWVTGALHDATGAYTLAFVVAIGCSVLSATAIWLARLAPSATSHDPTARRSTAKV